MSARPGRILGDVPIDLPRRATCAPCRRDHRFHELYSTLWELLEKGMSGDED